MLFAGFQIYGPALRGPFLFDDLALPFSSPLFPGQPLKTWIAGVRPLLMLSFWANYRISAEGTLSYHVFNVLLHCANAALLFLALRRLMAAVAGPRRDLLAGFAAVLFLVHPLQSESVAYIAGRSETLSAFFSLAAFVVFLYRRRPEISWRASAAVLLLFACATASKEQALVLPALFLLTDYFWTTPFSLRGIRGNWRLYLSMLVLAAIGAVSVWKIVAASASAGFGLKEITWLQYFLTECRVLWTYIRLFVLPIHQTVDHDVSISRTIFDPASVLGLAALILLIAAAIRLRRRAPLAVYGLLCFLLLLAPTSSFVPLRDPIAEHRMYLPMIGLLFILTDILARIRVERRVLVLCMSIVVLAAGYLTYRRSVVWSGTVPLAEDAVREAPHKTRPYVLLTSAYMQTGRCVDLVNRLNTSARLVRPDYNYLVSWGMAYDCVRNTDAALSKFREAARIEQTGPVMALIGMAEARQGRPAEALEALNRAIAIDPRQDTAYAYRGYWYLAARRWTDAAADFHRALEINPQNRTALEGLRRMEAAAGRGN